MADRLLQVSILVTFIGILLILGYFYLTVELEIIGDRDAIKQVMIILKDNAIKHLEGDIVRSFNLLILEWLSYMHYLKDNYKYLFSLALRVNPFDPEASPVVKSS